MQKAPFPNRKRSFLYGENHAPGAWFQRSLMVIVKTKNAACSRISVRSANCTKKQEEVRRESLITYKLELQISHRICTVMRIRVCKKNLRYQMRNKDQQLDSRGPVDNPNAMPSLSAAVFICCKSALPQKFKVAPALACPKMAGTLFKSAPPGSA